MGDGAIIEVRLLPEREVVVGCQHHRFRLSAARVSTTRSGGNYYFFRSSVELPSHDSRVLGAAADLRVINAYLSLIIINNRFHHPHNAQCVLTETAAAGYL